MKQIIKIANANNRVCAGRQVLKVLPAALLVCLGLFYGPSAMALSGLDLTLVTNVKTPHTQVVLTQDSYKPDMADFGPYTYNFGENIFHVYNDDDLEMGVSGFSYIASGEVHPIGGGNTIWVIWMSSCGIHNSQADADAKAMQELQSGVSEIQGKYPGLKFSTLYTTCSANLKDAKDPEWQPGGVCIAWPNTLPSWINIEGPIQPQLVTGNLHTHIIFQLNVTCSP